MRETITPRRRLRQIFSLGRLWGCTVLRGGLKTARAYSETSVTERLRMFRGILKQLHFNGQSGKTAMDNSTRLDQLRVRAGL